MTLRLSILATIYPIQDGKTITNTPHAQFHVKCGKKYRFRVIGYTTINCDYQLAIEDHILKVIALDGNAIEPIYMTSITMGSGMTLLTF